MCVQFSPEEREQMAALKRAFDPAGLLNPGRKSATSANLNGSRWKMANRIPQSRPTGTRAC